MKGMAGTDSGMGPWVVSNQILFKELSTVSSHTDISSSRKANSICAVTQGPSTTSSCCFVGSHTQDQEELRTIYLAAQAGSAQITCSMRRCTKLQASRCRADTHQQCSGSREEVTHHVKLPARATNGPVMAGGHMLQQTHTLQSYSHYFLPPNILSQQSTATLTHAAPYRFLGPW